MLITKHNSQGMSLIEIMVAVSIVAIMFAVAAPNFSSWIQNTRIRNAAEAIQNGLQLAHSEAVHRNSIVRFQLTTTSDDTCALSTANGNWVVSQDDPAGTCSSAPSDTVAPRIIQKSTGAEVSGTTLIAADQSNILFNGLGRTTNIAGVANINISNPTVGLCAPAGPMRCLRVVVSQGGQVRMCDPALLAGSPQGC